MILTDIIIVGATWALFFSFAWLFFASQIFKNFELPSKVPLILFASTFTVSCSMFELVIFEILDILDRRFVSNRPESLLCTPLCALEVLAIFYKIYVMHQRTYVSLLKFPMVQLEI
jgi:lysylphosphatidylglycerol synthetase-like protein (DUF2156 family)